MAQCQAITASGNPCSCRARQGFTTCGRHKNVVLPAIDFGICGEMKINGSRCTKHHEHGDTMCRLHRTLATRREQAHRTQLIWMEGLDILWGENLVTDFAEIRQIVEVAFDGGWISQGSHDILIDDLHREWLLYRRHRITHIQHAKTDLQRLAFDPQNVHTKEVSRQTSDAQKYILETPVSSGQNTVEEIGSAWTDGDVEKVLKDIRKFYKNSEYDFLYKRLLDGLWARIQSHSEKDELIQRLLEETSESVTKCYQGHICRLGNVLVGFTEDVKAEVPIGEILQQKIAAISEKDIGVEYKVCEAWSVFEELNIPIQERDAWIEAF